MAYTQGAFGAPRYESSPFLTQGQIKRGTAPARNVFRPPSAGVSPSLKGPSSMAVNTTAPQGTYTNMLNRSANTYMWFKNSQQEAQQRAQQLAQKQTEEEENKPNPFFEGYQSAQRTQQIRQAQQQQNQLAQQNPLTQAWTQSSNNPANMPPSPPRKPAEPPTPFGLPPLEGAGGDFFMQAIRNADISSNEPTSTVQWKDEPVNPLPMGTFKPFDSSRMFDPTYKPSEESLPTSKSRTLKRPPKW